MTAIHLPSRAAHTGLRRLAGLLGAALLVAGAAGSASGQSIPVTDEEKTVYFLGVMISQSTTEFDLSTTERKLMLQGLQDAMAGTAKNLDPNVYGPKLQALASERREGVVQRERDAATQFLADAAKAPGARITESGLIITMTKEGSGNSPGATDTVRVHYHGTLRDGTVFDSSVVRKEPAEFPLNRVIPCWTEGVARMKPGAKARLVCPPDIAYGDRGAPPSIPGGAALTFDIELLEVIGQ